MPDTETPVPNMRALLNPELRRAAMTELFVGESLRVALAPEDYAQVKDLPVSLLEPLYRGVWFVGPYFNDFYTFHRELLVFTQRDNDSPRFREFERDLISTYQDRYLTGLAELARHKYFDATHAYAYGRVLMMGWMTDPKTDNSNLYKKFWAQARVEAPATVNTALGLLTTLILTRHITPLENEVAWIRMRESHDLFCRRWGFTPLAGRGVEV